MSISQCLIPIEDPRQAFWEQSARMYLAAMIGYVLECLLPEEHTLAYAAELFSEMPSGNCNRLFRELGELSPDSFAYKKRRMFSGIKTAEKMYESIQGILTEKPDLLTCDGPVRMYSRPDKVDFPFLDREQTAVFLTISDADRSSDRLASLFYTQALQPLCASADRD